MISGTLKDGRVVGFSSRRIASFSEKQDPDMQGIQSMIPVFSRLLQEYHQAFVNSFTCLELLWVTEPAKQQMFSSHVHVFYTVRVIENSAQRAEYLLNQACVSVENTLTAAGFAVEADCDTELQELIRGVDTSRATALVKTEQSKFSNVSGYPVYFCQPLLPDTGNNFESLVLALSQSQGTMFAVQLFPTAYTPEERTFLNGIQDELLMLSRGIPTQMGPRIDPVAAEAVQSISQAVSNADHAMYQYNIVVMGDYSGCLNVSSKLSGMIIGSSEGNTFSTNDISNEYISPADQLLLYPWNLNNRLVYAYRNTNLIQNCAMAQRLFRLPYILNVNEAVSVFKLPVYDRRMMALKHKSSTGSGESFNEKVTDPNNVILGVLAQKPNIQIGCPDKSFTKHMLVVGMPGSGKTTFSVNMLLQFAKRGIPFLAIEPTKSEYRAMIDAIDGLQIFTPGNNAVSPFIINPFIPPAGITVERYIPSLFSAFRVAFSMASPLDVIFLKSIRQCYFEHGWTDSSRNGDPGTKLFGIYEFILTFKRVVEEANYSKEVKGNLQSAGVFRLMNLIQQNSNIYDTVNTIPLEDLLSKPTVVELNAVDDGEQKALIISLLLINIVAYTKYNHVGDGKLKNIMLIDEAHVVLSPAGGSSEDGGPSAAKAAVKRIQDMIVEIRSYGTGIIIADQSPGKVTREVVANTDIKVAFRLVQNEDRQMIGDTSNMSENDVLHLSQLKPGEAYAHFSLLESPQLLKTPDIREDSGIRLSVPDEEIAKRMTYWQNHRKLLRPFNECQYCLSCKEDCDMAIRSKADYYAERMVLKYLSSIKSEVDLIRYLWAVPKILGNGIADLSDEKRARLIQCVRLRFARKIRMECGIQTGDSMIRSVLNSKEE